MDPHEGKNKLNVKHVVKLLVIHLRKNLCGKMKI